MKDQFFAEQEAYKELAELYERVNKCRDLFEVANLPLPDVLKRIIGMNGSVADTAKSAIPAPEKPRSVPRQATDEWIWIPAGKTTPQTLVLAILREHGVMKPKDLAASVAAIITDVSAGGVYNMGPRLDGKTIRRTSEGWTLINPEEAPILKDDYVWAPAEAFQKTDLAGHRRDAILHILKHFTSGLQTTQIVEELLKCRWMKAPANKDQVKLDMEWLSGENSGTAKVKRRGNSKKWALVT